MLVIKNNGKAPIGDYLKLIVELYFWQISAESYNNEKRAFINN